MLQAAGLHSKRPCYLGHVNGRGTQKICLGQPLGPRRDLSQVLFHMDLTNLPQGVPVLRSVDASQSVPLLRGPRSLSDVVHKYSIAVENRLTSCTENSRSGFCSRNSLLSCPEREQEGRQNGPNF